MRTLPIVSVVSILAVAASAQVSDYAIDAKGIRHSGAEYPRNHRPWRDDCDHNPSNTRNAIIISSLLFSVPHALNLFAGHAEARVVAQLI
jgi:hypothetical protein